MASLTNRNIDDAVKQRLHIGAVDEDADQGKTGSRIHQCFAEAGGIDLPEADRKEMPRELKLPE